MMPALAYVRPTSIDDAIEWLRREPNARALAGGQSLLAAAKLGLTTPTHLLDLRHIPELKTIEVQDGFLWIGAMVTHHQVATNTTVGQTIPMLSALARDIADQQVRNRGTIGGSVALHDPSACWPAGVLATGATIVTSRRELAADAFFTGLYATALAHDELILGLRFALGQRGCYIKTAQKASHFALVGAAVAMLPDRSVRVALTGLGHGVTRWLAAEVALTQRFMPEALFPVGLAKDAATSDLHASAAYRCHLARVLAVRVVQKLCAQDESAENELTQIERVQEVGLKDAQALQTLHAQQKPKKVLQGRIPVLIDQTTDRSPVNAEVHTRQESKPAATKESAAPGIIHGEHWLALPLEDVWAGIQDPSILERSIPGCESMQMQGPENLQATIKVGLGFISARFETQIRIHDLVPPIGTSVRQASLKMTLSGRARGLGSGQGLAKVDLTGTAHGTLLSWSVSPQVQGQLAQLGGRMMQATASKLSEAFFVRLSQAMGSPDPSTSSPTSKKMGQTTPSSRWAGTLAGTWGKLQGLFKRLGQWISKRSKVNDK